ncbi:MAG: disulfide bond formation protein B [Burkholderiales bacterium]
MLAILERIPLRVAFALGALACAALLGAAYYLQYFQGQDPCPLCLVQRVFYLCAGIVFLVGALHGPKSWGATVYGVLAMLFAAGGLATAVRQVYLQHLPPEKVPACGPDLPFMLENFPISRTLTFLVRGSGQCAEVNWRFLGLSIAEWSLICFSGFIVYALWIAVRGARRK